MGDLCSMHKGLAHLGKLGGRIEGGYRAQVFENSKEDIKPSVSNAGNVNRKHSGGVYSINTLDLQKHK